MLLFSLSLCLVPVIAWHVAKAWCPRYRWTIVAATIGVIAYPFLVGVSIPLLYAGPPIGRISSTVMLFHRAPGQEFVRAIVEHRRLVGVENLWAYALNAIHWGIVYGLVGWLVERSSAGNRRWSPLFLIAVPALIYLFPLSKTKIEAAAWRKNNPSGVVCFHLMNADSGAQVYFDTGSPPRIQLTRFGRGLSADAPYCGNYGLSLNPLTIQAYAATEDNRANRRAAPDDAVSEPLSIHVVAGRRTCVGIFHDKSHSPPKWISKIVDCALTPQSTGPAAGRAAGR